MYIPRLVTRACQSTNSTTNLYPVPSTWAPVTIDKSFEELNSIAQTAINVMRDTYYANPEEMGFGWGTGTTLSAFAYKDMIASTSDNHDFLKNALAAAKAHNGNFDPFGFNDDAQWWGTAAIYAHRAYGDAEFLQWAVDVWNWVHDSQITEEEAAAGKSAVREKPIQSQCNGKSVAGGVFWRAKGSDPDDMGANVITTGLFETLSAYLAEATGDQKYTDAAIRAYDYIMAQLMQESPNVPLDTLTLDECKTNDWVFTYNTGKFVEGAVILSSLTGDDKYRQQALKTVYDAITKTENWQNAEGFITEGQEGDAAEGNDGRQFKAIYVRALTEVARREYNNPDLKDLIRTYININYNAVINKDTDGQGNYGLKWQGPYTGEHESSQMNSIDLLAAGIEFNWKR